MKLKLLGFFLLCSNVLFAQSGSGAAVGAAAKPPVFVMLAPAGSDTGLEIRSSMRINITHIPQCQFIAYRLKDQAFLLSCADDASADAAVKKIKDMYRTAKVQQLKNVTSYINEGFTDVKRGLGRADPTFPIYYETGDNPLDARSYRIEKLDWIANHPMPDDGTLPGNSVK